jgi:hypothetical protein
MKDTGPRADALLRELMAAQSPSERFAMAGRMFDAARTLARAGIIAEHGADGETHMRKYLFLRFYGQDFDESKKRNILAFLGED